MLPNWTFRQIVQFGIAGLLCKNGGNISRSSDSGKHVPEVGNCRSYQLIEFAKSGELFRLPR